MGSTPSPSRRAHRNAAVAALREGREALVELDGQLDEILVWVKDPTTGLDVTVPDRLARSARRAAAALSSVDARGFADHALF